MKTIPTSLLKGIYSFLVLTVLFSLNQGVHAQKLSYMDDNEHLQSDKSSSLHGDSMSLISFLKDLEKELNISFAYQKKILEGKFVEKMDVDPDNLESSLGEILLPLHLSVKKVENIYIIQPRLKVLQDPNSKQEVGNKIASIDEEMTMYDVIISGKVISQEDGQPLPGVNVLLEGTLTGTVTDAAGTYSLNTPDGSGTLVFSFIGYTSQTIPIDGRTEINIELFPSLASLDEIVVIGYGQQERSDITGAISSVSGDEIAALTSGGVQEALQGRVAGVNITPTSGQPGGALDMNIRGVSTFGNGNPLFVIDGFPVLSEGISRNFNPLATINPDNIKSIQILKDASAAAIYGARAANGVVIITTNRGRDGATQTQLKVSRGVAHVTNTLPLMNSAQYIPYATAAYQNAGRPIPISFQEPLLSENLQTDTDWQEEGFSPATIQNYWLSISGGSENSNYSFSGGYTDQEGTLPSSGFTRYSTRINSDFKVGKKIKIGETIELSRGIWTGTFTTASFWMRQLNQQSPTVPVYNPDAIGGFDGPRLIYSPVGRINAVGEMTLIDNKRVESRMLGSAYAEYEILPGLTNRLNIGGEITFGETSQFLPTWEMGDRVRTIAQLDEGNSTENVYLIENITTYKHVFNDIHDLTLLVGFTQQESWAKSVGVQVRDFPSNDLRTVASAFEERDINGEETGWGLRSQIGRLNYAYDDKYNLMFTIRRDGSSRFGKNNRYGIFPSISGSWILTNEPFMDNFKKLSNLTLRASYGQVGSQDINNFAQFATIEPGENYIFGVGQGLVSGATYLSLGNSNLKWEVTTQTNIGLDMKFFDRHLAIMMDYYIKNTDDILLQIPIPTTSGIRRNNGPFVNAGSMQNKGFEFTADYQNNFLGDFNYILSGNISINRNKVTSLNAGEPIIAELRSGKQSALTITEEGGEIGAFYGYIMEGIFRDQADLDNHAEQPGSAPGDVKFRDLNQDGIINADDQAVIGSPFPDFTYGFKVNLLYKNFDLALFFQGKQGHDIYNLVWSDLNEGEGDNNATTDMLNRWTPDNRDTNVPRAVTGNPGGNTRPSTRFIEDGSYLRVQNVQLGYNLAPDIASFLKMSRLRVYVSAQNLFTFTRYRGYNPEIGTLTEGSRSSLTRGIDFANYPIPRVIEAGIQINFN